MKTTLFYVMDINIHSGWFFDTCDGLTIAVKVKELLCEEMSKHQSIVLFKSTNFGNVLVLDGAIQCTERDAFTYYEMMAHIPLSSHPKPTKVLVIGGDNGGVVSEMSKLSVVEEIHICVKDQRIMELSKQYLSTIAAGFSSSKVTVHIEEEVTSFLEKNTNGYDIIIVDDKNITYSSKCFYDKAYNALKEDGIICSVAGCAWTNANAVINLKSIFNSVFPVTGYAFGIVVPAFVGGQVGLMLGSKNKDTIFEEPIEENKDQDLKLQYYNREIHKACFVLPPFIKEILEN